VKGFEMEKVFDDVLKKRDTIHEMWWFIYTYLSSYMHRASIPPPLTCYSNSQKELRRNIRPFALLLS
jgi:hypothetical protein